MRTVISKLILFAFVTLNGAYGQVSASDKVVFAECVKKNHVSILLVRPNAESYSSLLMLSRNLGICNFTYNHRSHITNSNPNIKYEVNKQGIFVKLDFPESIEELVDTVFFINKKDTIRWVLDFNICSNLKKVESIGDLELLGKSIGTESQDRVYYFSEERPDRIYYKDHNSKLLSYYTRYFLK